MSVSDRGVLTVGTDAIDVGEGATPLIVVGVDGVCSDLRAVVGRTMALP
jgi:hypothetical protein